MDVRTIACLDVVDVLIHVLQVVRVVANFIVSTPALLRVAAHVVVAVLIHVHQSAQDLCIIVVALE